MSSTHTGPRSLRAALKRQWACNAGAELAEFAVVLPIMMVIFMGIFDFGSVFTLRDKLTNSVREAARLAVRQGTNDLDQAAPPSVQQIRDTVANYLLNANVTTCAIGATPTKVGGVNGMTWTYSSSTSTPQCSSVLLTIERSYTGSPTATINGSTAIMTRVTLTYPYTFFAFSKVISLVAPGAIYPGTLQLTTQAVMQNL